MFQIGKSDISDWSLVSKTKILDRRVSGLIDMNDLQCYRLSSQTAK